jgi:hypothetical protein
VYKPDSTLPTDRLWGERDRAAGGKQRSLGTCMAGIHGGHSSLSLSATPAVRLDEADHNGPWGPMGHDVLRCVARAACVWLPVGRPAGSPQWHRKGRSQTGSQTCSTQQIRGCARAVGEGEGGREHMRGRQAARSDTSRAPVARMFSGSLSPRQRDLSDSPGCWGWSLGTGTRQATSSPNQPGAARIGMIQLNGPIPNSTAQAISALPAGCRSETCMHASHQQPDHSPRGLPRSARPLA